MINALIVVIKTHFNVSSDNPPPTVIVTTVQAKCQMWRTHICGCTVFVKRTAAWLAKSKKCPQGLKKEKPEYSENKTKKSKEQRERGHISGQKKCEETPGLTGEAEHGKGEELRRLAIETCNSGLSFKASEETDNRWN